MSNTDSIDWAKFQSGDDSGYALERIYNRNRGNMLTYCLYLTGNRQLSEDIVQDSFLKLAEQKGSIKSIKDWLFICVRNAAFNSIKKGSRNLYQPLSNSAASQISAEQKLFIKSILGQLETKERALILMREHQRYSIREISSMLEISEEAVRVRLFRIRKKMQSLATE